MCVLLWKYFYCFQTPNKLSCHLCLVFPTILLYLPDQHNKSDVSQYRNIKLPGKFRWITLKSHIGHLVDYYLQKHHSKIMPEPIKNKKVTSTRWGRNVDINDKRVGILRLKKLLTKPPCWFAWVRFFIAVVCRRLFKLCTLHSKVNSCVQCRRIRAKVASLDLIT